MLRLNKLFRRLCLEKLLNKMIKKENCNDSN